VLSDQILDSANWIALSETLLHIQRGAFVAYDDPTFLPFRAS